MFAPYDASSGVFQPLDDECHTNSIRLIFFRLCSPSSLALGMRGGKVRSQQRLHGASSAFSWSSIPYVPRTRARTHWWRMMCKSKEGVLFNFFLIFILILTA